MQRPPELQVPAAKVRLDTFFGSHFRMKAGCWRVRAVQAPRGIAGTRGHPSFGMRLISASVRPSPGVRPMGNSFNRWTPAEDEIVRNNTIRGAVALLSRSAAAVKTRRMGLDGVKRRKHPNRWTKREDLKIAKYRNEPLNKLARRFPKRTFLAVRARRFMLFGCKPIPWWTTAQEKSLWDLWPSTPRAAVMQAIKGRTWTAIKCRANLLGITRHSSTPLLTCPNELKDAIRQRAREDGISLTKIGAEIGFPSYFKPKAISADMNKIAKAVAFFGGRLVIDWQDE
jgi:hypothetical protein